MPRNALPLLIQTVFVTLITAHSEAARAEKKEAEPTPIAADQVAPSDPRLVERDRLADRSQQLVAEGKLPEALELADQVLAIEIEVFGEQHEEVANSWDWIGRRRLELDQFPEAIAAFERQAAILAAAPDAPDWKLADARRRAADARLRQGLSPEQHAELQRAAKLQKQCADFYAQGKDHEALPALKEILSIRRKVLGEEHPDAVEAYNNLGYVFDRAGEYAAARSCYEEALRIARKVLGENHPSTSAALNNLGFVLEATGDYAAARTTYEHALTIKRKTGGDESLDTAVTLNNLGGLQEALGDFGAARAYYEKALAIRRKICGEGDPVTAGSLNNVGLLLWEMGDYRTARPYLEQALAINRRVLGEVHPDTATSLNNLGLLLQSMGDNAAARPYFEQALAIDRKTLGEEHPVTASILNNLGLLLESIGDDAASRPCLEQALAIYRTTLGEKHPDTARALNALGLLLESTGDYAAARPCYEQALAIRRQTLGDAHPATATSLNNLGLLLHAIGDDAAAQPYYDEALAIRCKVLGEDHPDTALSRKNLGLLLAAAGKLADAAEQFVAAAAIERRILDRELFTLSEAKMQLLLDQSLGGLDVLASLPLAELHRETDAATLLLSRKAISFEVLNRRRAAGFLAETDPEVARRRAELLVAQKQLDDLAMRPPRELPPAELNQRRQALRAECDDLENQLSRSLATFLKSDASLAVSLDAVRGKLPAGAALVEFVWYRPFDFHEVGNESGWQNPKYAAFVLSGDPARPLAFVDLGPALEIDAVVGEASAQIRKYARSGRATGDEATYEETYREVAARLYAKLLAPLEPALAGAKRVFLGPDSRLHEIPFEALVDSSGRYLVEAGYQFSYINSGRDLLRPRSDVHGDGVIIFAGPNYDENAATRLAVAKRLQPELARQRPRLPQSDESLQLAAAEPHLSRSADTRLGWRHLPGADLEGVEAGAAFSHAKWGAVRTYTGDDALEDLVKRVERPRALIFVTHGDFLEDQPAFMAGDAGGARSFGDLAFDRGGAGEARAGLRAIEDPMLRSYLLLAGANKIDEPLTSQGPLDNGWLTAQEIAQLDLRGTDLVVLSACNTSRGKAQNGQAVTGMRSAFLFAGARTIVGSLYAVPNAETRQLLKPFYEGVAAGEGKLASLNAAKLDFIERRREQSGGAHPFFWASFVLVGEP